MFLQDKKEREKFLKNLIDVHYSVYLALPRDAFLYLDVPHLFMVGSIASASEDVSQELCLYILC